MRLIVLPTIMVVFLSACGGGQPADPATKALPTILPTVSEVRSQFSVRADQTIDADAGYWTNDMVAESGGGSIYMGSTATGRITGYRATYYLMGRDYNALAGSLTASVLVDLYRDEESAANAIADGPTAAVPGSIDLPGVGDEAVAWGFDTWTAPSGTAPKCPCDFRFRVGRIVGSVVISYPGPPVEGAVPDQVDPIRVALARIMAERMRQVTNEV